MRVIVTGSKGLIGSEVTGYLKEKHDVVEYDFFYGDDLRDEDTVRTLDWKADALINLFALNDHVDNLRCGVKIFEVTLNSVRSYLETNLVALFSVCREYGRQNEEGSIINFSSTYGIDAPKWDKHIGYTMSKAGVIMLTKHLAVDFAPKIRVNCIAPGGVAHDQGAAFQKYYGDKLPLKRMMQVHEINKLIEYMCFDATYMTGAVVNYDGGWTCW